MSDNHLHEHEGPTVKDTQTWLYWWHRPGRGDIHIEAHAGQRTQRSTMSLEAASAAAFDVLLARLAEENSDA